MLVLLHCGIFVALSSSLQAGNPSFFFKLLDTLKYLMFFAQERLRYQMIQYKSCKY